MKKTLSRQRRWQIKQRDLGHCILCGALAALTVRSHAKRTRSVYCESHKAAARERVSEQKRRKRELADVKGKQ